MGTPLKIQQRRDTALLTPFGCKNLAEAKHFSLHIINMLRPNILFAPCLAYNQPLGHRLLVA